MGVYGGATACATTRRMAPPGCQPRLTSEQLNQLPELLERGAEAYGFRG